VRLSRHRSGCISRFQAAISLLAGMIVVVCANGCGDSRVVPAQSEYTVRIKSDGQSIRLTSYPSGELHLDSSSLLRDDDHYDVKVKGDGGRFVVIAEKCSYLRVDVYQTVLGADAGAEYSGDGRIGGFRLGPYQNPAKRVQSGFAFSSRGGFDTFKVE
jgi:hypothetical protein